MPSLIGRFKVAFLLSTLDPHVAKRQREGRQEKVREASQQIEIKIKLFCRENSQTN